MKSVKDLFDWGLVVVLAEIRGAKPDSFSYVNKKTGLKEEVKLVRLSLEVGSMAEQVEGSIDGEVVPAWAVKGHVLYLGCSEAKREMRRRSVRIVDVAQVESPTRSKVA